MRRVPNALIWIAFGVATTVPMLLAAMSSLLAWRDPIYIVGGFAGIAGLVFLLAQPLLAGSYLPGLSARRLRVIHKSVGVCLVVMVLIHVAALWITSPPDVIDVLLFRSPTPFSVWGVAAMWAVFAAALLAASRQRLRISMRTWRLGHTALVSVVVVGTVVHAMLIEGTMELVSKAVLCALVMIATVSTILKLQVWKRRRRRDVDVRSQSPTRSPDPRY